MRKPCTARTLCVCDKASKVRGRVAIPPDLIVEVLSPETRAFDRTTKRRDYEQLGVREYWMIDQHTAAVQALRLEGAGYVEVPVPGEKLASTAIPGSELDLTPLKKALES